MLYIDEYENTDTCYTQMNIEGVVLSERSQSQKSTYCMVLFVQGGRSGQISRDKVD